MAELLDTNLKKKKIITQDGRVIEVPDEPPVTEQSVEPQVEPLQQEPNQLSTQLPNEPIEEKPDLITAPEMEITPIPSTPIIDPQPEAPVITESPIQEIPNLPEDDIMISDAEVPALETPAVELGKPLQTNLGEGLDMTVGSMSEQAEPIANETTTNPVINEPIDLKIEEVPEIKAEMPEIKPEIAEEKIEAPMNDVKIEEVPNTLTEPITPMVNTIPENPTENELPPLPQSAQNPVAGEEVFVSRNEEEKKEEQKLPEAAKETAVSTPTQNNDYEPKIMQARAAEAPEGEPSGKWILDSRNENPAAPVPAPTNEKVYESTDNSSERETEITERAEKAMYDHEKIVEKNETVKESSKNVLDSNFHNENKKTENLNVSQTNNVSIGGPASKGEEKEPKDQIFKGSNEGESSPFVDYSWIILLAFIIGMILLLVLVPSFRKELLELLKSIFETIKNAV